jgi:hypothetical protein
MKKRRIIQPILWTERPTGAVRGGWFTLALFLVFHLLWVVWFTFDWQGFIITLRTTLVNIVIILQGENGLETR